jgi:molybdenum cofactor synthesis domain-containing protein
MKVLVLTISDRASQGVYEDLSGPAIECILRKGLPDIHVERSIVPDERLAILHEFAESSSYDVVLTTGGTGLSPRDVTPEATAEYCDRLVPGIAEILRAQSWQQTPNAIFSRGTAGMKGKTLFVNFPGSVSAAEFCANILVPVLPHAVSMAQGQGH